MSQTQLLNLEKGQKLELTKDNAALKTLGLGLYWQENAGNGPKFDLDAFAVCLGADGKLHGTAPACTLYYGSPKNEQGQLNIYNGALTHTGDNRTGAGAGDDETIIAKLDKLPAEVHSVMLCVNIYESHGVNFGQVKGAGIHAYDADSKAELAKYDLSEDYSAFDGVIFARLYRHNGEWKFEAVGEGFKGDINSVVAKYNA